MCKNIGVLMLLWLVVPGMVVHAIQSETDKQSAVLSDESKTDTHQAAEMLSSAMGRLEHVSLEDEEGWIVLQLASALIANNQYADAKSFGEELANERLRQELIDSLFRDRIDQILGKELADSITPAEIDEVKELFLAGNQYKLMGDANRIEQLIQHQRFGLLDELVESGNGNLNVYRFQEGSSNVQYRKLQIFRSVVSAHLRGGSMQTKEAANDVISRIGIDETRDDLRIVVIQDCLREGHENIAVAEALLKEFETDKKKFWGAFRLGTYFTRTNQLKDAEKYAAVMEETYPDADPRYQQFYSKLLICIAQMKLSQGMAADQEIARARVVGGADRENLQQLTCIYALSGRLDRAMHDSDQAYKSISVMLDLFNRKYIQCPALQHVPADERIQAAIDMAKEFENPLVRAAALSEVARVVSGIRKSDFGPINVEFRHVPDNVRAKELLDQATMAADSDESTYQIKEITHVTIDQSWAFSQIAAGYAKSGYLLDAANAMLRVSDEEIVDQTSKVGKKTTARTEVALKLSSELTGVARPFEESNSHELFGFLERLNEVNKPGLYFDLSRYVGNFLLFGSEENAILAFQFAQENFSECPSVPSNVVKALAEVADLNQIQSWFDVCNDVNQQRLLASLCSKFNNLNAIPNADIVRFIDQHVDKDTRQSDRDVSAFLVSGLYARGEESQSRVIFSAGTNLEPDSDDAFENKWMMVQALDNAMRFRLPELAMELFPMIDDRETTTRAAIKIGWMMADRNNQKAFDAWRKEQTKLTQTLVEIGIARKILKLESR